MGATSPAPFANDGSWMFINDIRGSTDRAVAKALRFVVKAGANTSTLVMRVVIR
jgi:hypothetical protein